MIDKVKALIDEVIRKEGGFVNHPRDRGGPTKYGITLKTLEAWRGDDLDPIDVRLMHKSEAVKIYEHEYYLRPGIDGLPELIQEVVFDMCVNMGPINAIKIMQMVIHKMGSPITVDGIIGPRTRQSALVACNVYGTDVLRQICAARINYYQGIVDHDPGQAEFLKGWKNRAELFLA
jgi:lysozyme family protein